MECGKAADLSMWKAPIQGSREFPGEARGVWEGPLTRAGGGRPFKGAVNSRERPGECGKSVWMAHIQGSCEFLGQARGVWEVR